MIHWGDHLFFEKSFENTAEVEMEKVRISVMDYNFIGKNSIVGSFDMDLLSIYFSENHAI